MHTKRFHGSVTRITDLEVTDYEVQPLPRSQWASGDYVVGEVVSPPNQLSRVELKTGRLPDILQGDQIVGAFGCRAATLEATGDWSLIGEDGLMEQLTPAGLFAKMTSCSHYLVDLPRLKYVGHVLVDGQKRAMQHYVKHLEARPICQPIILLIGTSMSSGKTTTARVVIRKLRQAGKKVVGAKLTGAGRYRDVLSMRDAGANEIFDFVDVGLPSTVCEEEVYLQALGQLISRIAEVEADVVVVEVGASPLEPYNGEAAIRALEPRIAMTILCASDPYAAVGVIQAFGKVPDLVTGIAATTLAGIELVEKLTGVPAINILARQSDGLLDGILADKVLSGQPATSGPFRSEPARDPCDLS
jgi:hypothetical protein